MRSLFFIVTLESDTVISSHSGTAGGHRGLDYIPGANFLGAAARTLYRPNDPNTFDLFHSGRVRFLPAYPMHAAAPSLPMPYSFHSDKLVGDAGIWSRAGTLAQPQELINLAAEQSEEDSTLPQWRSIEARFISRDGSKTEVPLVVIPKTALNDGVARESHLFAYQAMVSDTRFGLELQLDDAVPKTVDETLVQAFDGNVLGIGRSRSAEFGRARVRLAAKGWQRPAAQSPSNRLLLYCYSDLALLNPTTGQPTLRPSHEHFGISSAHWDAAHSFITTRRYSPFNGYRRRPDPERQVIAQGSVIAFNTSELVDVTTLENQLAVGVGCYREVGLGQVWVHPEFLAARNPKFSGSGEHSNEPLPTHDNAFEIPVGPLVDWLHSRQQLDRRQTIAAGLARAWAGEIADHIPVCGGLTRSQWGFVRDLAAEATSGLALYRTLFGQDAPATKTEEPAVEGVLAPARGVRSRKWKRSFRGASPYDTLEARMRDALWPSRSEQKGPPWDDKVKPDDDATALHGLRMLAERMPREMAQRKIGEAR